MWVSQHDKRTEYDYKIIFNCRKIDRKRRLEKAEKDRKGRKRPEKTEKAEKDRKRPKRMKKAEKDEKGRKRPEKAGKGRKRPEKAQTLKSHTSLYVLSLIKKNRIIK